MNSFKLDFSDRTDGCLDLTKQDSAQSQPMMVEEKPFYKILYPKKRGVRAESTDLGATNRQMAEDAQANPFPVLQRKGTSVQQRKFRDKVLKEDDQLSKRIVG